jgi:hypothetical protein
MIRERTFWRSRKNHSAEPAFESEQEMEQTASECSG